MTTSGPRWRKGTVSQHSDKDRVRELARTRTVREVSELTGIPSGVLRNWRRRYSIKFVSHSERYAQPPRSKNVLRAKELLDEGNGVSRVALMLGVRTSAIRNWASRYDWDIQESRVAGVNCDICKHPQKHKCSQYWCACEINRDITPPEKIEEDDEISCVGELP